MALRGWANSALRIAHAELRRKPRSLIRSPDELHVSLDLLAAHWVTRHPTQIATAVQIGAFDGAANDPLADAIARFHWRAILVEPQPRPAALLVQRYANDANVTVIQAAVSEHDGTRRLYSVRPGPQLPPWAGQIASFDRSHLERQGRVAGVRFTIEENNVPTMTPETLMTTAAVDRIDVLQIDTEGYDLEILRLFDVARRRPAIINYEHQHLRRSDQDAAAELLIDSGYRVALNGFDTIAYHADALNGS